MWNYSYRNLFGTEIKRDDWVPLVLIPLMAAFMLVFSVVLLIIFRQHPTFVITTVTTCLIVVTVYLTFVTVDHAVQQTFE